MIEAIYTPWYFSRTALAEQYLDRLFEGHGAPLALFAPRRVGKTSFLVNELSSEALDRGLYPVYMDLWQHRSAPLTAINYALQEALDDLNVPANTAKRRLATPIKKIALAGAALDFGEEPTRRRPEEPTLLVDWLIRSCLARARRPLLLLFDEVQELALRDGGEVTVSALRTALTKHAARVRVIFTGSSQEQLRTLFFSSRAALYETASLLHFPLLGDEFVAFVVNQAKRTYRRSLDRSEVAEAFARLHHQPRALLDLVFAYCSSDNGSLTALLAAERDTLLADGDYESRWRDLNALQKLLCMRIAADEVISSQDAREYYSRALGRKDGPLSPGSVNSGLRQLQKAHVITRQSGKTGAYQLDDPLFAEWIRRLPPALPPNAKSRRS